MKYTLENFFEELAPDELDEIMPDNFDAKLQKKVLKRIETTVLQKSGIKNNRRRLNFKIFAPAAACLVFMVGIGGFVMVAEAKEYNAAVDFFAQNGLSAEGLSHEDLKAVYRDISTNRFANDKTAEVIRRSVPGVEILQEDPTPEEVEALWNCNIQNRSHPRDAVEYRTDYKYKSDVESDDLEKIIVECLRDGESLWKTEFPSPNKKPGDSFYIDRCVMTSAGTAVWGNRTDWTDIYEDSTYGWFALIDDSGNKMLERELNHGFHDEYIAAVLDNGDDTWAVISHGDFEYLCLAQYDINGNELTFKKTKVGDTGISNATRLGDGYLVQFQDDANGDTAHLVKLGHDGSVTGDFVYESEDCDYYITDMTEFEGNIYLSAYAVPKQSDAGGRHEIADVLDYVSTEGNWEISPEELTPVVQENYTAVLLLCDPNGGEPKRFYSVKGSLGGALTATENQLEWNVETVVSAYFSPLTSSFSIGGECRVYRYSFDTSGALAGCEDTGETTGYAR